MELTYNAETPTCDNIREEPSNKISPHLCDGDAARLVKCRAAPPHKEMPPKMKITSIIKGRREISRAVGLQRPLVGS